MEHAATASAFWPKAFVHIARLQSGQDLCYLLASLVIVLGNAGGHPVGAAYGTSLYTWALEIDDISVLVDLWDSIEAGRIRNLKKLISWNKAGTEYRVVSGRRMSSDALPLGGPYRFKEGEIVKPARLVLQQEINKRLGDCRESRGISYEPCLVPRMDGNLHLFVRPNNLLSAIWLQFVQVVGGSYKLRQCPICRRHFLPKRSDAVTCKDSCRQKKSRKNREAN